MPASAPPGNVGVATTTPSFPGFPLGVTAGTFSNIFDTSLAIIGLFSFYGWWNLGHYHFDHYVHIWEHYHYYVGAKYGPELRFARLYECTAAADMAASTSACPETGAWA